MQLPKIHKYCTAGLREDHGLVLKYMHFPFKHGFTNRKAGLLNTFKSRKEFVSINTQCSEYIEAKQVHKDDVYIIPGKFKNIGTQYSADSIVYINKKSKSVCIGIKTADCVPVLISNKDNTCIAVVHSGWKGTFLNIVKKTINVIENNGYKRSSLLAAIGPSINSCCYKISDKRAHLFCKKYKKNLNNFLYKINNKWHLSLPALVLSQLYSSGIHSVFYKPLCSACQKDLFYSFRAEALGLRGTMVSYICSN